MKTYGRGWMKNFTLYIVKKPFFISAAWQKISLAVCICLMLLVLRPAPVWGSDTVRLPKAGTEWGVSQGEWSWYPWQLRHVRSVIHTWYPYITKERKRWDRLNSISESLPRYKTEAAEIRRVRQMTIDLNGDGGGNTLNMGLSLEEKGLLMDLTLYKSDTDPQWYAYSSLGYKNGRINGRIWFDNKEFSSANIEVSLLKW